MLPGVLHGLTVPLAMVWDGRVSRAGSRLGP